ncbi:hypothetical protein [Pseudarthrobacter siccitolerans]
MPLISTYYDGPVTESDRAKNPAGRSEYGVYGNEDFRVTAHPSIPYAVLVKKGRAHGHGVTDEAEIDQVVNCPSLATGFRWDLIVIRRNWQPELGGPSTLEVIEAGTEAQIPTDRKVGPGVEDDQPIALVKWQGGVSAPVEFRDLRVWSNNAGMFAVDPMVRQYLATIGTEVNISGEVWSYQRLSATDADWVKTSQISRIPLFGANGRTDGPMNGDAVIEAGNHFLIQAGSSVGYTDGSGYGRITWPKPFPNGVLTVLLSNGDSWATGGRVHFAVEGNGTFWGPSGGGSKNDVVYISMDSSKGGASRPNMLHRINWIAIGW